MMSLKGLIEKTPEADVLREMISFAAAWLVELEVGALTSTTYGEKRTPTAGDGGGQREDEVEVADV